MIHSTVMLIVMLLIAAAGFDGRQVTNNATAVVAAGTSRSHQSRLRVAIIGFANAKESAAADLRTLDSMLGKMLAQDARVSLIDQLIVQPALAGVGYDGSINMSWDDARRIGSAIGCDFLILGKAEALTRSERENQSHEAAFAGVMIVDARSGALSAFDFVSEKASTREEALKALLKTLRSRSSHYIARMIRVRTASLDVPRANSDSRDSEIIEDLPEEDSTRVVGFKAPEFLNRVKPEYSAEADLANITAIVEATAVFRSNGEVGAVETSRWSGFGLDESAERAIRQLKFKPATRDGKPVSVRALIRYTFRRVSEPAPQTQQIKPPAPADKPARDLRQLFKPSYRRP